LKIVFDHNSAADPGAKFHWNRTFAAKLWSENDFQYGGSPPS